MANSNRRINKGHSRDRHISVRAVRRESPDLRKLSRALIQYALEAAAAEAAAQAQAEQDVPGAGAQEKTGA